MPRGVLVLACVALSVVATLPAARSAPVDPAGFLFVASAVDPVLAIIDSASDTTVAHVRLPEIPRQIIARNSGREVLAGAAAARKLYRIDTVAARIAGALATSIAPALLQIDRSERVLAIGNPDGDAIELVQLPDGPGRLVGGMPGVRSMAFTPGGRLLVGYGARIAIVAPQSARIESEFRLVEKDGPVTQVASTPGGEYAFVLQGDQGVLSIFDLKRSSRVSQQRLPAPTGRLLPSPDSQFVLLPVAGGRAISVISTWTLKESARLPTAAAIDTLALGLFQSVSVAVSRAANTVQITDLRDRRSLAPLKISDGPTVGAISADGFKFYLALGDTGRVAVIDLLHAAVGRSIDAVVPGAALLVPATGTGFCH